MIRIFCTATAMATMSWLDLTSPAKAVDEFPPSKDCKPISYCVKYRKGEPGQLAGRCVRWAQILPCTPVLKQAPPPSPEEKTGITEKPGKGIGDILKETRP